MKICIAQTRPLKGDITGNIEAHTKLIEQAVTHHTDVIIFPELSITGYEPHLAKALATNKNDGRLDVFQQLSDKHHITIGAGIPTPAANGQYISMIVFQPGKERAIYSKQYLHEDEFPFFVSGNEHFLLGKAAISICYELSVPEHAENTHRLGAEIYLNSSAKTVVGAEKAHATLAHTAAKYGMMAFFSNCAGHCDDFDCGGRSAIWNSKGELLAELDAVNEGILIADTTTQQLICSQQNK